MFINNWYAACEAADVTDQPRRVRMLGCDFVLFRDARGRACCLSDTCCHRGASLSGGKLRGGELICPQHGWEFNSAGRCIRIPAGVPKPAEPPKRARVPSYPVVERYGLLFVFLGDLDEGARPELPDLLPEFSEQDRWYCSTLSRREDVNFMRMIENYNDPCHVNYVHEFGQWLPEGVTIETQALTETYVKAFHAAWDQHGNTSPDRGLLMEYSVVGLMSRNTNHQENYPVQIVLAVVTPIDIANTQIHMLLLQPRAEVSAEEHQALVSMTEQQVMDEDREVLARTKPLLAAPVTEELIVETDLTLVQARKMTSAFGRAMGEIDVAEVSALVRERIFVIPCPGHREDPKAWIHKTVPLLPRLSSPPETRTVASESRAAH